MCSSLTRGEPVIADRGYRNAGCIAPDDMLPYARLRHGQIRAKHKTCKERFKRFSILGQLFPQNVQLHGRVFHAASKIVALSICHEKPLFQL